MDSILERRSAAAWRATGRKLVGTVVRFGVETRIGDTIERVARGAFDDALRTGRDILALVDHNPSSLLARTTSGTLRLRSTPEGLDFELDVPDTALGRDTLALAERGDLGGMSFGFAVPPGGDVHNGNRRELRQIDLREISIVQSWPAYPQTTVAARARTSDETRRRLAVMRRYLETV